MNSLNKKQITDLLPHREPMLLIDELYDIKKLFSATAVVNVKKDSFLVQGHFPGQPVMPGVLIVESFGQAAAALTAHGLDKSTYENKLSDELNEFKKKEIKLFFEKINPIIEKYMEQNSIALILDKKNIFVARSDYDMTQELLDLINKD